MAVSDLIVLSDLLDKALDLDDGARALWVADLNRTDPGVAARLQALLSRRAELETDHVLIAQGRSLGPQVLAKVIDRTSEVQPAATFQLQEGDAIGPYRLIRALGEGGMASVWLAERRDGQLKRQVALKLLHSWRNSKELVERFARERDMLAGLVHPNIARLYDAGVTPTGQPWIALEYVEGLDLAVYADRNQLSIRQRVESILQVMSAVQHAHQNLIVHRDIKPRNILVNKKGEVRLLDFGIAKLLQADAASADETELTKISGRALTLRYAAPEQIEGKPITTATDVYALGLVLYELLTGTSPRINHKTGVLNERSALSTGVLRPSRGTYDVVTADARGHVTPKEMKSTLTGDLDTIVLKALAHEPQRRYPTVSAFAADLTAWLERRPIAARAPTLSYQLRMFVSRQRVPVAVGALAMLALAVAGSYSLKQRANAELHRARAEEVHTFMANLLSEAEPEGVEGEKALTAKGLLDAGTERARYNYAAKPLMRGEMLVELARVYLRIGEKEAGEKLLIEGIALIENNAPADEPSLQLARSHLGGRLLGKGEQQRAVNMLNSVLTGCEQDTRVCYEAKGTAHLHLALNPSASNAEKLVHARSSLELFDQSGGGGAEYVLHSLSLITDLERVKGNLSEAGSTLARAETYFVGRRGKSTERTMFGMTKTSLLIDKGAFSEAAELVDRLLIDLKGTKRANVLMRLHIDRAHIANYQGLTTLAIEHTRAARSIAAAFEPSVLLAYGLRYEARALSMAGEHSSAAKSIGEAFEMLRKMGKSEQSEVWQDMLRASGEVKARSGNWSEARKDLEEMLGTLRAFLPDNFRDQINTLDLLGAVSLAMGDAQFALTCHDEEIRLLNKHLSPDHPLRLRAELRVELAKTQMGNVSGKDKRIIELVQQLKSPLPEGSVHTKVLSEVGSSWGSASGKRQLALIF